MVRRNLVGMKMVDFLFISLYELIRLVIPEMTATVAISTIDWVIWVLTERPFVGMN